MLNTYINQSKEYIPYAKTIIEKKAPTDDSIKLYDEIKEKAYNSILYAIPLEDNVFKGNLIIYQDICQFNKVCKYLFFLNGIKYEGSFDVDDNLLLRKDELIFRIYKRLSDEISKQLFKPEMFSEV